MNKLLLQNSDFKAVLCHRFLLHYTPTTRAFVSTDAKSSGDQVIDELKVLILVN